MRPPETRIGRCVLCATMAAVRTRSRLRKPRWAPTASSVDRSMSAPRTMIAAGGGVDTGCNGKSGCNIRIITSATTGVAHRIRRHKADPASILPTSNDRRNNSKPAAIRSTKTKGGSSKEVAMVFRNIGAFSNLVVWTDFPRTIMHSKQTIASKLTLVLSHRSATRLKRFNLPTACSMRSRGLPANATYNFVSLFDTLSGEFRDNLSVSILN